MDFISPTATQSSMNKSQYRENNVRSPSDKPEGTITADGAQSPRKTQTKMLDDSTLENLKEIDIPDGRQQSKTRVKAGLKAPSPIVFSDDENEEAKLNQSPSGQRLQKVVEAVETGGSGD